MSTNGYDLIRDMPESEKLTVSNAMQFLRKEINKACDLQAIELYERRIRNLMNDDELRYLNNF